MMENPKFVYDNFSFGIVINIRFNGIYAVASVKWHCNFLPQLIVGAAVEFCLLKCQNVIIHWKMKWKNQAIFRNSFLTILNNSFGKSIQIWNDEKKNYFILIKKWIGALDWCG